MCLENMYVPNCTLWREQFFNIHLTGTNNVPSATAVLQYSRTGKQRGEPAYSCPRDFILPMRTVILSCGPIEVQARSSASMMLSQIVSTSARSQWPEQWMIASLHSHRLNGSVNSSYSWKHRPHICNVTMIQLNHKDSHGTIKDV